jgi:hypothetical protein
VVVSAANNRCLVLRLRDGAQLALETLGSGQTSSGARPPFPEPAMRANKPSRTALFTPHHIICCAASVVRGTPTAPLDIAVGVLARSPSLSFGKPQQ